MSFVRSYVFLRLGKAKAYSIPTCQVHTSCESPVVEFGKEILTRSSFASSVSYHNIDEASLIIISQNKSKQDRYGDAATRKKKYPQKNMETLQIWIKKSSKSDFLTHVLGSRDAGGRLDLQKSHVKKCLC